MSGKKNKQLKPEPLLLAQSFNSDLALRTRDVAKRNTLVLSDDPVAADAKAAMLFGKTPMDIGFIRLRQKWGLGTYDFQSLVQKKINV